MSAMSDYLENVLIDWIFRGQAAPTLPANLYYGLFTTAAGDAGGQVEVSTSGTNYARQPVARSLAAMAGTQAAGSTTASTGSTGTTSNNAAITFGTPSANWGTITGWGIFDAVSGGNLLFFCAQTPNKTVNNGDPAPSFAIGAAQIQIDN